MMESPDFLKDKAVLLINPPWKIMEGNIWKSVASCYPSLGLALLAGYLEKCGARVKITDMQARSGSLDEMISGPAPDFVGITSTTVLLGSAFSVAEKVKRIWPRTKIVMGGVHPTVLATEVLRNPDVDYVIRGEGERSLAKLVGGLKFEDIPGLAWMENGRYREHPDLDELENLDDFPMPAYHLLPMDSYYPPLGGALNSPSISFLSTRGCPGRCTYCNSSLSKRLRFYSASRVVDEINHLMVHYGIREVTFYDDSFCASRKRVQDICRLFLERRMRLTWTCMSRINFADQETLGLMAQAGCHMICYGVESADESILRNIKKHIDLNMVAPVVRMTQRAGIRVRLSFMFGNPGETVETMEKTIRFAVESRPDLVQFNITTPFPGTEMFEWADYKGLLLTKDWSKYDLWNVVMRLPGVTEEDIHRYYKLGTRRFYSSAGFIWRFIWNLMKYPVLIKEIIVYICRKWKAGVNLAALEEQKGST